MYHIVVRLLLSACGLGLADYLLEGIRFDHFSTLFWAALLWGVANSIVKPILIFYLAHYLINTRLFISD